MTRSISQLVFDNATYTEAIRVGLDIRFTDRGLPYCFDRRLNEFIGMTPILSNEHALFAAIDHALEGDSI